MHPASQNHKALHYVEKRSPIIAGFIILFDVAYYRLKKMEMANLIASAAIMLTVQASMFDFSIRMLFGLLLNILIYMHNDYCDIEQDLKTPKKKYKRVAFLYEHLDIAYYVQLALLAILILIGFFYDPSLLVALVLGGGICWLYSQYFKNMPYYDIAAMVLAGAFLPLIAFQLNLRIGWVLVIQLALFAGSFEAIQILRDYQEDKESNIITTAVLLGKNSTRMLVYFITTASSFYAYLVLSQTFGLLLLASLFIPFNEKKLSFFWNLIRLCYGITWIAILVEIYLNSATQGLLINISISSTLY